MLSHNEKVDASPWNGYDLKVVPPGTCLRGVELDDFIKISGQLSPEILVENYINENLSTGNYDFIGNNILASLVWDKIKDNVGLRDTLIAKFASSYWRQLKSYGMKYENIRENFKTITELDGHLLDKAVNTVNVKVNNP